MHLDITLGDCNMSSSAVSQNMIEIHDDRDMETDNSCDSFLQKKISVRFHAAFVFIYIVIFTTTVNSIMLTHPPVVQGRNDVNKIYVSPSPPVLSNGACEEFHRFPLTEELYITVCSENGRTLLHVNQHNGGQPGNCGVFVSKMQWLYLKRTESHIDKSIQELERLQSIKTKKYCRFTHKINMHFKTPTSIVVIGGTMSGKTHLVWKILQNASILFDVAPTKIVYCYLEEQPIVDEMESTLKNFTKFRGYPSKENIREWKEEPA